jgi:AcrR family transcriptional regulator
MVLDARVARSRAKLRDALLALVGERKLEAITVADIVKRAGVSYPTFFRHYAGKSELWHDITDGLTTQLQARIAPFVDDPDTMKVSREFCAFVAANRDALSAILAQGAEGTVRQDLVNRSAALVAKRAPGRLYGLPGDLALLHATNASVGIVTWWLEHYESVTIEEVTEIIDRLVNRPLRSPVRVREEGTAP